MVMRLMATMTLWFFTNSKDGGARGFYSQVKILYLISMACEMLFLPTFLRKRKRTKTESEQLGNDSLQICSHHSLYICLGAVLTDLLASCG